MEEVDPAQDDDIFGSNKGDLEPDDDDEMESVPVDTELHDELMKHMDAGDDIELEGEGEEDDEEDFLSQAMKNGAEDTVEVGRKPVSLNQWAAEAGGEYNSEDESSTSEESDDD